MLNISGRWNSKHVFIIMQVQLLDWLYYPLYIPFMLTIVLLILAVIIASWSSIIIRLIGDVHPLIISFYRLILSALFFLPFWKRKQVHILPWRKSWIPILLAGFFLSMHFYSWIASLQLTSVGNSVFLESTHPLFALFFSIIFLKEKVGKKFLPVILLGLSGMIITVSNDINADIRALTGDFLAILGAIFVAAYLIIARKTKLTIPLIPYLTLVYGAAAGFILLLLLIQNIQFWDLSTSAWLWLFLLAAGPNFMGHSILNWASRRIPVYIVNTALLSESVLATVYAALILGEIPGLLFYIGAILIINAVIIALWIQKKIKIKNYSNAIIEN